MCCSPAGCHNVSMPSILMDVEVIGGAQPDRDGGVLLPPVARAVVAGAGRAGRAAVQGAGRSGAAAAVVAGRLASTAARRACATSRDAFDVSQPTISHHLKVLHEAGLVDREKRAMWVYYRARHRGAGQPSPPLIGGRRPGMTALLGPAGARRVRRHRVPGRRGRRLRHRRHRLSPRRRPAAAGQQRRHRCCAGRADPRAAADLGRVQPGRHPRRTRPGRDQRPATAAVADRRPARRRRSSGAIVANLMFSLPADDHLDPGTAAAAASGSAR